MNQNIKRILITLPVLIAAVALFSFSASAALGGDIDRDGMMTPADARAALRMSVGLDKSVTGAVTKVPYSDLEKDIADIDMDLSVSPADARVILRIAVKLEKEVPYYECTNREPPTCIAEGVNVRVNTTDRTDKFLQIVPALGHDFSVPISFSVRPTCTVMGTGVYQCSRCKETKTITDYVEHVWREANCINPKTCINCGATSGSALGHDTMLGVCSRCGQYQGVLYDYYSNNIKKPLNNGKTALEKAHQLMYDKYSEDYTKKTLTLDEVRPDFITAYNYYYAAYEACKDYKEFEKSKELIYTICYRLMEIIYSPEVTTENYSKTLSNWTVICNQILGSSGYNASLKAITDTFKDPYAGAVNPGNNDVDTSPTDPEIKG